MALPRLNENSQYELTIPSNKEVIHYRPFLVKEQKVLMIAYESQDRGQILLGMLNTIEACVKEEVDVKKLSTFDVDYIFTQIRGKSVGETSDILIKCENVSCGTDNEVKINLESIKVDVGDRNMLITITDDVSVRMRFPSYENMLSNKKLLDAEVSESEKILELVITCIDAIETGDERISLADETEAEITGFLDSLTTEQFDRIALFAMDMPVMKYDAHFTCTECGTENVKALRGLDDFF